MPSIKDKIKSIDDKDIKEALFAIEDDLYSLKIKENKISLIFQQGKFSFDWLATFLKLIGYDFEVNADLKSQRVLMSFNM